MSRFDPFYKEHLTFTDDLGDVCRSRDLYTYFEHWCQEQGIKVPLSMWSFVRKLKEYGAVKADRGGVARWSKVKADIDWINNG